MQADFHQKEPGLSKHIPQTVPDEPPNVTEAVLLLHVSPPRFLPVLVVIKVEMVLESCHCLLLEIFLNEGSSLDKSVI